MVSLSISVDYARFLLVCRHSSRSLRYTERGRKREADRTSHFHSSGFQLHIALRVNIASFGIRRRDVTSLLQHADRISWLLALN
jgi:hypothetical protein